MKKDTCEARKPGGGWHEVGLAEAKLLPSTAEKRCPVCGGAVYIYPKPEQFEHVVAHSGCPRSGSHFTGVPSPHPQALQ
jgi:hypothetical protein